jgi:hypothetical protein
LRGVYEHHIANIGIHEKETKLHTNFSTPVSLNAMLKSKSNPNIANLVSNHRHPYMRRTEAHTEGIQP